MKPVPMLARLGVPRATMPGRPVFFFTSRAASAISSRVVGTLMLYWSKMSLR